MKKITTSLTVLLAAALFTGALFSETAPKRPNILFAIADDWGWPHAGAYGDPVVKTPTFDRLAKEGILFNHAYVSSPSCTPSRGAILTGQWHWRLGGAGNLWSVFPDRLATYPELLEKAGYHVGATGKAWGPGRTETRGRNIAGKRFKNFAVFLSSVPAEKPFCFWLGTSDPHRPFRKGSGEQSGMKIDDVVVPACFPNVAEIRGDVADYYWEVQRFDRLVGAAVAALKKNGQLDNTIIFMTGDHGLPFPRSKSNLYDTGTRVGLALRWGTKVAGGRTVDDFVSLTDLAPTFLEAAGVKVPADMTGRSLLNIFRSKKSGQVEPGRGFVLTGKERHVPGQEKPDMGGYPCRAIRTHQFLYIRNFKPERWPAGTPDYEKASISRAWLADCDNGPTKTYMVDNKDKDSNHRRLYQLSFGKRPADELYDLSKDPHQLNNVAGEAAYAGRVKEMSAQLMKELAKSGDPRARGDGDEFDRYPYLGGAPKFPGPRKKPAKPKAQKKR